MAPEHANISIKLKKNQLSDGNGTWILHGTKIVNRVETSRLVFEVHLMPLLCVRLYQVIEMACRTFWLMFGILRLLSSGRGWRCLGQSATRVWKWKMRDHDWSFTPPEKYWLEISTDEQSNPTCATAYF